MADDIQQPTLRETLERDAQIMRDLQPALTARWNTQFIPADPRNILTEMNTRLAQYCVMFPFALHRLVLQTIQDYRGLLIVFVDQQDKDAPIWYDRPVAFAKEIAQPLFIKQGVDKAALISGLTMGLVEFFHTK